LACVRPPHSNHVRALAGAGLDASGKAGELGVGLQEGLVNTNKVRPLTCSSQRGFPLVVSQSVRPQMLLAQLGRLIQNHPVRMH